jgi:hypothetical protein
MDIQEIENANRRAGLHFFDSDTLKFFSSRVDYMVYSGAGGIFFVTSEKFRSSRGSEPRAYTVREFNPTRIA